MGFYARCALPWAMERLMRLPAVRAERIPSLASARGRVLEIGFGCGGSLAAYPAHHGRVRALVGLDSNEGMLRRAEPHAASAPFPVRLVLGRAEDIPCPDEWFDTVVSHWTLCSIPDPRRALGEIRRILRPEGRFLFLEHGRAAEPRLARWQRRLSPVHGVLAGGCRLDVSVDEAIHDAGLEIEVLERYESSFGPRVLTQMYRGVARPGSRAAGEPA